MTAEKEIRYLVLKLSDIKAALSTNEIRTLSMLCDKVSIQRHKTKPPLECVVVEKDWPEYEGVWQSILDRINLQQTNSELSDPETITHHPLS